MTIDRKEIDLIVKARTEGTKNLADVTRGIEELQKAIDREAEAAKRGEGSISRLRAAHEDLKRTQDNLGDAASLIGALQKQEAAVSKIAERVKSAGERYEAYKSKLAGVSAVTDAQQTRLIRLAAAHERAQAAQAKQQADLARLRTSLEGAGVATDRLADAELRVRAAAAQIGAAMAHAKAQIDALSASTGRAAGATNSLARASSDLRPRVLSVRDAVDQIKASSGLAALTRQVLGLAAAYTGVQGAVRIANEAISAFNTREGVRNQLALSVGTDRAAIDEEYAYVKAQADRIGVEFENAVRGYAKFAAAAKLAGRSRQEIRYIFEAFTEVGRVANLSREDLDGVFKALEQITSKGKIQAEELRGQLGDRLFGAFQIAAKALKDTYPDLDKALKDGLVSADQLLAIAEEYRKTVGGQLAAATGSLAANQARFNTALFEFKLAIADAGFADRFAVALQKITEFLRSDDGKRFAESLSSGFSSAADVVVLLVRNLDTVKVALGAVLALWATNTIRKTTADVIAAASAMRGLGTEAGVTAKAFAGLQAGIVGYSIGTYLYSEFATVRKAGAVLVTSYAAAWEAIKAGAEIAFEEIPRFAKNAGRAIVNTFTDAMRTVLRIFRAGAAALGLTSVAENVDKVLSALPATMEMQSSRTAQIVARAKADIAAIRSIMDDMVRDAERVPAAAPAAAPAEATARPTPGKPGAKPPTEEELRKRATLIEGIQRQLETLDAGIDRAAKANLSQQLDAIDTQYAKLQRQINTLGTGTKDAVRLTAELESLKGEKRLQVTREYNAALLRENEAIEAKLDQADAAAGRKQKTDLDARLAAIRDSYAATFRQIEEQRARLQTLGVSDEPAQLAKERLQAAVQALEIAERTKFATEELARREAAVNQQIALRDKLVAAVKAREAAGKMTEAQAADEINATQAGAVPAIEAAALATREWALANAAIFSNPEEQAAFIATLDALTLKATTAQGAFTTLEATIVQTFTSSATSAINQIAEAIGGLIRGTMTWREVLRSTVGAVANVFAEVLKGLAQVIIRQQVLNAVLAISKALGWSGVANAAISMGAKVLHEGGTIGAGSSNRVRDLFANMPRYHSGGFPGMTHREQLVIAEKGEEILSKDSPRNILNGGAAAGGTPAQQARGVRFVLVDDRSRVAEAMQSPEGDEVIMQSLRRHLPTIKQWVK